jgi:hypothetical protein
MMDRQNVAKRQHVMKTPQQPRSPVATLAGQDAFATMREIVEILVADPKTDWSKVNIDALRQHLVDMNNVTLNAKVTNVLIDSGMIFVLTGEGPVCESIRRMTTAHAVTMDGIEGWRFEADEIEDGANLVVHAPRMIWKSCAVSVFSAFWRSACIIRNTT